MSGPDAAAAAAVACASAVPARAVARGAGPPPRRTATRPTSSAGRCATRCSTGSPPTGTSRPTPVPTAIVELFPGAVYENRFGTVAVRRDDELFEITTFRTEHDYADHRRPHRVEFGDDLEADLARRDFTVNAMAWGGPATAMRPGRHGAPAERASSTRSAGSSDLGRHAAARRRRSRRDGSARTRCGWSARSASPRPIELDDRGGDAGRRSRPTPALVEHLSGERVGAELSRLLEAPAPSIGLRLAMDTGLLAVDRARARRAAAASPRTRRRARTSGTTRCGPSTPRPSDRPIVRLAALLHDVGKPSTLADGRFHHHDAEGARIPRRPAPPAALPADDDRGRRAPRRASTCSPSTPTRRTSRSGGSSGASGLGTSTRCSSSAGPTTSAAALAAGRPGHRRLPRARRRRARRPAAPRPAARSPSTATT